jgi:hypothetical protein
VMSEQNRLHRPNPSRQELGAHIRAGIHKQPLPLIAFDQNRGSRAPIPRLRGVTGPPIAPAIGAANQRDAGRTATAKNRDRDQASSGLREEGFKIASR